MGKGDCVRLSQEGLTVYRGAWRLRAQHWKGKIVNESRDKTCWLVVWDGRTNRVAYAKEFLEKCA